VLGAKGNPTNEGTVKSRGGMVIATGFVIYLVTITQGETSNQVQDPPRKSCQEAQ